MFNKLLVLAAALVTAAGAHDFTPYTVIDAGLKDALGDNRQLHFGASGHTPGNVAVFGNSITQPAAFWAPFADTGSVAGLVPGTNRDSYLTDKTIMRNCAVSGYTIGAGLGCIDTAMVLLKPEVVVCLYGTNDTWSGDTASYKSQYRTYLDKLLAKGVIPIICTIPPLRAFYGDSVMYDQMTAQWNAAIRAVAKEKRVVLADYWQGVMDYTDYAPFSLQWYEDQFIHPNGCSNQGLTDIHNPGCGQGIHNAVVWDAVNKVYRIIIENGDPDTVTINDQFLRLPWYGDDKMQAAILYNTRGKLVRRYWAINPITEKSLEHLPKGVYLVRIVGRAGEYFRKVVVFD